MKQTEKKTNIVDELVAQLITDYFTIFPTREHVLNHILLGIGTSYEWKKGSDSLYYLRSIFGSKGLSKIPSFMEDYPDYTVETEEHHADVEFQDMLRDWTNKHIKLVSQRWFWHYCHKLQRPVLRSSVIPKHCPLGNLPAYEDMHPDWRDAIEGFCEDMVVRMRQEIACPHGDDQDEPYPVWLMLKGITQWVELAQLLERALKHVVSEETRQKRKAFMESVMADIKAEESTNDNS
jgi:hypothetical protein